MADGPLTLPLIALVATCAPILADLRSAEYAAACARDEDNDRSPLLPFRAPFLYSRHTARLVALLLLCAILLPRLLRRPSWGVAVASGESLLGALCVSIGAGAFVWLGGVFVRPDDAGVADVGMVAGVVVWDELVRVCGLSPRQWRIEGLSLTTAGAMCGALLGGLITLLDWDTSWQQWPLPGVWGTLLGSSLARLIQRPLTHLAPLAPPELT